MNLMSICACARSPSRVTLCIFCLALVSLRTLCELFTNTLGIPYEHPTHPVPQKEQRQCRDKAENKQRRITN